MKRNCRIVLIRDDVVRSFAVYRDRKNKNVFL